MFHQLGRPGLTAGPSGPSNWPAQKPLFLRLWLDRRLAGWRNDVLQSHVGDQVAVVFHVVHVVDSQHVQFRCVVSEELYHLSSGRASVIVS